jgi:hypothetical protein
VEDGEDGVYCHSVPAWRCDILLVPYARNAISHDKSKLLELVPSRLIAVNETASCPRQSEIGGTIL